MTRDKRIRKVRARQKADGESSAASDTAGRFDGQLPPILPELQWPEELSRDVGKGALRRLELTNRAYSAAVYAHADHFPPRWESLLLGQTKKLLRSEKEELLRLFERECFAVLSSLRECLGVMRAIPPAERIVLLNDYQAWMRRVKDLLREAVFAGEPEEWDRDLLRLVQNHKPDEPSARETFRYLVEKPVFFEQMYLQKFSDLFFTQMELEERLGLMNDIVLDLIRACEARMQAKRRVETENKQQASETQSANNPAKRFAIALSFPGERPPFIQRIASHLADQIGQERVLYDKYHEAEFAQPDLDVYLPNLYSRESELIVIFLCADYAKKRWCKLEWRSIRQLISTSEGGRIMFISFDDIGAAPEIGILSGDGYVSVGSRKPDEITALILERLELNRQKENQQ